MHEGVRLEFARRDSNTGVGGGLDWQSGMDALSGGQRTMVCLTVVVAVGVVSRGGTLLPPPLQPSPLQPSPLQLPSLLLPRGSCADSLARVTFAPDFPPTQLLCVYPTTPPQAAMAGGGTSVMLMDEVDAALDETNQHLVSICMMCNVSIGRHPAR